MYLARDLSALLIAPVVLACHGRATLSQKPPCSPTYEVYAAVMREVLLGQSPTAPVHKAGRVGVQRIVVLDHTKLSDLDEGISALEAERNRVTSWLTLADYRLGRDLFDPVQGPFHLEDCFGLDVPIALISDTEVDHLLDDMEYQGRRSFSLRYPGAEGIVTLSRVAFGADSHRALVYVSIQRSVADGRGCYVLLQRGVNGWAIEARFLESQS